MAMEIRRNELINKSFEFINPCGGCVAGALIFYGGRLQQLEISIISSHPGGAPDHSTARRSAMNPLKAPALGTQEKRCDRQRPFATTRTLCLCCQNRCIPPPGHDRRLPCWSIFVRV